MYHVKILRDRGNTRQIKRFLCLSGSGKKVTHSVLELINTNLYKALTNKIANINYVEIKIQN